MRILMVCMGNICRSPLAEAILKDKFRKSNIDVIVESAGTIRFHEAEGADARATEIASWHHLSLSDHTARGLTKHDLVEFDKIYVMDAGNYHDVKKIAGQDFNPSQVDFILNEVFTGQNREVPDPYYGGKDGFESVFQLLDKACSQIALNIKANSLANRNYNQPF